MHFPASPDAHINDLNGKDLRVQVTKDHKVFIGGVELPAYIAEGGLRLETGGQHGINQLVVHFLVGDVDIEDEVIGDIDIIGPRSPLKTS
jgi:hypothetical protein